MRTVMNFARCVAILLALACLSSFAQTSRANGNPDTSSIKLEKMPQPLEIRFALSALPPHLRGGATTYVLDPAAGYVLAEGGTNGFSCIVVRTEWSWPQLVFRDDIFFPICYDEEGSKKMLPVYMDAARMRATGLTPKQVYDGIMNKFSDGSYQKPARTGISYMTAPLMRTYPSYDATEVMTMSLPHYMFYAPNIKDADIGGKPSSQYPFVLPMGPGPHDVIILLVGETEKARIVADSADLLKGLCSYRKYLCLNTESHEHH